MRFSTRIWIIVISSLLGLVIMGAFGLYSMRKNMIEERKAQIAQLLKFADGQLRYFYGLEQTGKLTRDEAQARAKESIGAMKEGNDYFHIRNFTDDVLLVHAATDRIGKVDDGGTMADGRTVVTAYKEELQKSRSGFAYVWAAAKRPDRNDNALYPKLSGVEKFEAWNWLVGIGFFMDDVNELFWRQATIYLLVGGIVLVAIASLVLGMRNSILHQLGGEPEAAAGSMAKIANGDLAVEIPLQKDDNSSLMASLKLMQMKLKNISSTIQENADELNAQVHSFEEAAKTYSETKSEEQLGDLQRSVKKLGRTADMLGKSVARIKL